MDLRRAAYLESGVIVCQPLGWPTRGILLRTPQTTIGLEASSIQSTTHDWSRSAPTLRRWSFDRSDDGIATALRDPGPSSRQERTREWKQRQLAGSTSLWVQSAHTTPTAKPQNVFDPPNSLPSAKQENKASPSNSQFPYTIRPLQPQLANSRNRRFRRPPAGYQFVVNTTTENPQSIINSSNPTASFKLQSNTRPPNDQSQRNVRHLPPPTLNSQAVADVKPAKMTPNLTDANNKLWSEPQAAANNPFGVYSTETIPTTTQQHLPHSSNPPTFSHLETNARLNDRKHIPPKTDQERISTLGSPTYMWNDDTHSALLEAVLDQHKLKSETAAFDLESQGWINVTEIMKKKFATEIGQRSLKAQLDHIRGVYRDINSLRNRFGFQWDGKPTRSPLLCLPGPNSMRTRLQRDFYSTDIDRSRGMVLPSTITGTSATPIQPIVSKRNSELVLAGENTNSPHMASSASKSRVARQLRLSIHDPVTDRPDGITNTSNDSAPEITTQPSLATQSKNDPPNLLVDVVASLKLCAPNEPNGKISPDPFPNNNEIQQPCDSGKYYPLTNQCYSYKLNPASQSRATKQPRLSNSDLANRKSDGISKDNPDSVPENTSKLAPVSQRENDRPDSVKDVVALAKPSVPEKTSETIPSECDDQDVCMTPSSVAPQPQDQSHHSEPNLEKENTASSAQDDVASTIPEKSSTAVASTSQINKTPHDPTLEAITLMAPMFVDQVSTAEYVGFVQVVENEVNARIFLSLASH
ncbi:hypothetical protein PSTT_11690 [Puccinia striiformis]|uniref:Myb/SANT-like domain-containing protein n=1 Tax=Puccinia striiformis TaxID=27350 RepID=A0A2S4UZ88_9BASI|nr:hypothetical protein PSTT_11690 [Puccinia striiformis]